MSSFKIMAIAAAAAIILATGFSRRTADPSPAPKETVTIKDEIAEIGISRHRDKEWQESDTSGDGDEEEQAEPPPPRSRPPPPPPRTRTTRRRNRANTLTMSYIDMWFDTSFLRAAAGKKTTGRGRHSGDATTDDIGATSSSDEQPNNFVQSNKNTDGSKKSSYSSRDTASHYLWSASADSDEGYDEGVAKFRAKVYDDSEHDDSEHGGAAMTDRQSTTGGDRQKQHKHARSRKNKHAAKLKIPAHQEPDSDADSHVAQASVPETTPRGLEDAQRPFKLAPDSIDSPPLDDTRRPPCLPLKKNPFRPTSNGYNPPYDQPSISHDFPMGNAAEFGPGTNISNRPTSSLPLFEKAKASTELTSDLFWGIILLRLRRRLPRYDINSWMLTCEDHLTNRQGLQLPSELLHKTTGWEVDVEEYVAYIQNVLRKTRAASLPLTIPDRRKGSQTPKTHETAMEIVAKVSWNHDYGDPVWAFVYITLECLFVSGGEKAGLAFQKIVASLGEATGVVELFHFAVRDFDAELRSSLVQLRSDDANPPLAPIVALAKLYEAYLNFHIEAALWLSSEGNVRLNALVEKSARIEGAIHDVLLSLDRNKLQSQVVALTPNVHSGMLSEPVTPAGDVFSILNVAVDDGPRSMTPTERDLVQSYVDAFRKMDIANNISWPGTNSSSDVPSIPVVTLVSRLEDEEALLVDAIIECLGQPQKPQGSGRHGVVGFMRWQWLSRDESALEAVKGLIQSLLHSQTHLRRYFDDLLADDYAGHQSNKRHDFDSPCDFMAMSILLYRMVQDDNFEPTCFVLVGADTHLGNTDQDERFESHPMLELIGTTVALSNRVKWILPVTYPVPSKRSKRFKALLSGYMQNQTTAELQMDAEPFTSSSKEAARLYVSSCISDRTAEIYPMERGGERMQTVSQNMSKPVGVSSLLWVDIALSCVFQANTLPWDAVSPLLQMITSHPSLTDVYGLALELAFRGSTVPGEPVGEQQGSSAAYCKRLLVVVSVVYFPITVRELALLCELPAIVNPTVLIQTLLPAFLVIAEDERYNCVYFRHRTAQEYIMQHFQDLGQAKGCSVQVGMAQNCLRLVLRSMGCTHHELLGGADEHQETSKDTAPLVYSPYKWIEHLSEPDACTNHPEALALAVHLLSEHLDKWLLLVGSHENRILDCLSMLHRLQERTVVMSRSPAKGGAERHERHKPTATLAKTVQVVREATIALQWHYRCTRQNKRKTDAKDQVQDKEDKGQDKIQIKNEDDSQDDTAPDLTSWLLFASDVPNLREVLLPRLAPWLETPPAMSAENGWGPSLHDLVHSQPVRCCAFSPDGRLLASASDDGRIRLWDTQTGHLQDSFAALVKKPILGMAIVPWRRMPIDEAKEELQKGENYGLQIKTNDDSGDDPRPIQNSEWVLTICSKSALIARSVLSSEMAFAEMSFGNMIHGMATNSKSGKIAVAGNRGVLVWDDFRDLDPNRQRGRLYKGAATECVAFTPDGTLMASTEGKNIVVWDATKIEVKLYTLPSLAVQVSKEPSGERSTSRDKPTPPGHVENVTCLAFSADSRYLVSGSMDLTARVWDLQSRTTVAVFFYHSRGISSVAFSPDGSCIALGSSDNTISIWKQSQPGVWGLLPNASPSDGPSDGARPGDDRPSTNGNGKGTANSGGSSDDKVDTHVDSSPVRVRMWPDRVITAHTSAITSVAFSPRTASFSKDTWSTSCCWFASSSIDNHVRIWDFDTAALHAPDDDDPVNLPPDTRLDVDAVPPQLSNHPRKVTSMALSPDGNMVATGYDSGAVCFWDSWTNTRLGASARAADHANMVFHMLFSPDGARLATLGRNGGLFEGYNSLVCIWDVPTSPASPTASHANLRPQLSYNSDWPINQNLSFSRDGTLLCALKNNGEACVFNLVRGRTTEDSLNGHAVHIMHPQATYCYTNYEVWYGFRCSAFSPDAQFLAVGTDVDGYLIKWRLDDKGSADQPAYRGCIDNHAVTAVAYSNDGQLIVTRVQNGLATNAYFAVWTWDATIESGSLHYRIVSDDFNLPLINFEIRLDLDRYPGIVFTETGPLCINLGENQEKDGEGEGLADTKIAARGSRIRFRDSDATVSLDTAKGRQILEAGSRWTLPLCGVYGDFVKWNDHVIPIPAHLRTGRKSFVWFVQGRVVLVYVKGGFLLFRFSEDANPILRNAGPTKLMDAASQKDDEKEPEEPAVQTSS